MATLARVLVADAAVRRRVSATALAAGLLVGLAECLSFAFTLARPQVQLVVWQGFGYAAMQAVEGVAMTILVGAPVLAGWTFAWRLGVPAVWWRTALAGPSLLVASLIGVLVAGSLESLGVQSPDTQRLLVFRVAFTLASAIAALACTYSVASLLRVDGAFKAAMLTAAATGGTYLVFALLIDPMPGWHVGGGDKAMVRVAMLGNLLAGSVGGTLAFRLLSR